MNILMVGPSLTVKGGMTTVISSYLNSEIKNIHNLQFIASMGNGNIIQKFIKEQKGLFEFKSRLKTSDLIHIHIASRRSTFRKLKYINLAYKNNKKIILHMHGGNFKKFFDSCSKKQQLTIIKAFNKCNKLITLTDEWKSYFSQFISPEKITVIHNGVPEQKFIRQYFNYNACFVGRIVKEKGIFELIEAFKVIAKKFPEARLFVAGNGEAFSELKNRINKLGMEEYIKLLGWVNSKDLEYLLKQCTFNIIPSYFEALPMTIIEAMSFSEVVVASNVGGIPTIIKDGTNGILVKPQNINDLTKKLLKVYSSQALQAKISANAKKTVSKSFTMHQCINKTLGIYKEHE